MCGRDWRCEHALKLLIRASRRRPSMFIECVIKTWWIMPVDSRQHVFHIYIYIYICIDSDPSWGWVLLSSFWVAATQAAPNVKCGSPAFPSRRSRKTGSNAWEVVCVSIHAFKYHYILQLWHFTLTFTLVAISCISITIIFWNFDMYRW